MTANALPISRLVNVAVSLTPQAAQSQNLHTLLVLGNSQVIDTNERYRSYSSLSSIATDFGTTAPEYLAAALWFEQAPQPTSILIGRWAQTATHGRLRGATLTAAQQTLTNFTAVTNGGFTYTKDGGAPTNITALNLSTATSLNSVASLITAALTGVTVTWNSSYQRFEAVSSASTGTTSSISFWTAPGAGTDLSSLLGMQNVVGSGAYTVAGIVAESALAAATLFDANYGQLWYALMITGAVNSDHLAVGPFIEATTNKHVYGVSTQETGCLVSSDTSNIAYQLKALGLNKTAVQYSSYSAYAAASLLGRILTVDYTGNNTTITLMFKQEPGIAAENLNASQADALASFNCNAFILYNNNTAIIQNGVVSSGEFLDTITGTDAYAVDLQNDAYNLLYTSVTKIPQTDAGMHLIKTQLDQTSQRYVTNGLFAPGVWNAQGFGALNQGDFLETGYYTYAPPVASQSTADRAARKSVSFQIAAKLAGAVHSLQVNVTVNQ